MLSVRTVRNKKCFVIICANLWEIFDRVVGKLLEYLVILLEMFTFAVLNR